MAEIALYQVGHGLSRLRIRMAGPTFPTVLHRFHDKTGQCRTFKRNTLARATTPASREIESDKRCRYATPLLTYDPQTWSHNVACGGTSLGLRLSYDTAHYRTSQQ